jgi:hypothetical protein
VIVIFSGENGNETRSGGSPVPGHLRNRSSRLSSQSARSRPEVLAELPAGHRLPSLRRRLNTQEGADHCRLSSFPDSADARHPRPCPWWARSRTKRESSCPYLPCHLAWDSPIPALLQPSSPGTMAGPSGHPGRQVRGHGMVSGENHTSDPGPTSDRSSVGSGTGNGPKQHETHPGDVAEDSHTRPRERPDAERRSLHPVPRAGASAGRAPARRRALERPQAVPAPPKLLSADSSSTPDQRMSMICSRCNACPGWDRQKLGQGLGATPLPVVPAKPFPASSAPGRAGQGVGRRLREPGQVLTDRISVPGRLPCP